MNLKEWTEWCCALFDLNINLVSLIIKHNKSNVPTIIQTPNNYDV